MRHQVVALVRAPVSPFELSCAAEVFGLDRPGLDLPYSFEVCTELPGAVRTLAGYDLLVRQGLEAMARADTIIVAGWDPGGGPVSPGVAAALRTHHRRGARVIAFCGGAYALAAAGLLDGRSATTHWRLAQDFARAFPLVHTEADPLFIDHGDVATSAGTAAAIDLSLALVRRDFGVDLADTIARHMVMPPRREAGQVQYAVRDDGPRRPQHSLAPLTQWVTENLDQEITLESLAARAFMSPRSLARRFQDQLGTSPAKWVLQQRIEAARRLLETTDLSIDALAVRTGFASAGNLRRHFRRTVGTTPSAYRSTFSRVSVARVEELAG